MQSDRVEQELGRQSTAGDSERRRVVQVILRTCAITAVLVAVVSTASGRFRDARTAALAAGYLGVLRLGSRRWPVELLTLGATLGLAVIGIYALVVGDGIHDAMIVALPIAVLSAGMLLDARRSAMVTAVAILGAVCVGLAEMSGALRTSRSFGSSVNEILVLSILLLGGAAISSLAVRTLHRALQQARAAERNYRELFDNVNEAIFVHDPLSGRVVDVNDSALAMMSCTREQILSREIAEISAARPPFSQADALAWLRRAVEDGPQIFEWLSRTSTGREFWAEVNLRSVRVGGVDRILAVVRDIHDRKRMQDLLRQADRLHAVGQLAGGVAHDFNNQLTGILGYVELLQQPGMVASHGEEALQGIRTAAQRAADLTRQLLAFARKGKVHDVPVDLHQTVREVTALLARSIDKRIEVEQRLLAPSARTMGDPSQLSSALLNLAINARDAMSSGGRLTFASELVDIAGDACRRPPFELRPGRYVRLSVIDTGVGIQEEQRAHLFEPFFTTKESGTGMGLPAVYGTVTAHDGAIEIESEPGRGTTFTMLLPHTDAVPVPDVAVPVGTAVAVGKTRVLVVDDEPLVTAVMQKMLARAGYDVEICNSPVRALQRVRSEPSAFHLFVLDMIMPEMTGEQFLAELRAIVPRPAVVFVSGYASDVVTRCLADVAHERFVAKPFTAAELLSAVASALCPCGTMDA